MKGATSATLNDKTHNLIADAFIAKYGDKAGWAHQILFAGDLASFKDKLNNSTSKATPAAAAVDPEALPKSDVSAEEGAKKKPVGKKRTFSQVTKSADEAAVETEASTKVTTNKRRKVR